MTTMLDPDLHGHDSVQRDLLHAIRSSRLGHSYLFLGPEGVGKKRLALALARALVCESPVNAAPCGVCRQCSLVSRGIHADVQLFERDKSTFSVEQMRETILPWASRTAREGRAKVGILNDIEHLGHASANAFLKTLEEPPSGTYWLLISSREGAVLSTIRSRCREVRFSPLGRGDIETLLEGPLRQEMSAILAQRNDSGDAPKLTITEREFLLDACEGAPGRMLHLMSERLFDAVELLASLHSGTWRESPVDGAEKLLELLTHDSDETQEPLRERMSLLFSLMQRRIAADTRHATKESETSHFMHLNEGLERLREALTMSASVRLVADTAATLMTKQSTSGIKS